jgi:hypothetical protein
MFDWAVILSIPLQVAQLGSLPWLIGMLVAINFGTAVIVVRAIWRECGKFRRQTQVRHLLARMPRHPRRH